MDNLGRLPPTQASRFDIDLIVNGTNHRLAVDARALVQFARCSILPAIG
jgi:hypothetical protein